MIRCLFGTLRAPAYQNCAREYRAVSAQAVGKVAATFRLSSSRRLIAPVVGTTGTTGRRLAQHWRVMLALRLHFLCFRDYNSRATKVCYRFVCKQRSCPQSEPWVLLVNTVFSDVGYFMMSRKVLIRSCPILCRTLLVSRQSGLRYLAMASPHFALAREL